MKQGIIDEVKQKFHEAQERIALRLLIWFEKEPAQDRVVTTPVTPDAGPYLRYRSRAKRRAAEKETCLPNHIGHAK